MIKKSAPIFFKGQNVSVDTSAGVIKGVVILQSGKDKVGDNFDSKALAQLVALGNSQGQGVKSRNGHPNMCDSSLGAYIGRYKNFSTSTNADGREVVVADLYLDETARKSPKGDSYDYILEMAQKNSEMFGNSIVYSPDKPEVKVEKDENGNDVTVTYERFKSFIASDLVDSPAATTSLFKDNSSLASIATEFLDENPEIFELLSKDESPLNEFLAKYKSFKNQKEQMAKAKKDKSTLDRVKEIINGAPETKAMHETADGKKINIDGPIAEGSAVSDEAGNPTPDASYTLKDGTVITTDAESKISSVTASENRPEETPSDSKALEQLRQENKSLKDEIAKMKSDHEAENTSILEEVKKMKDTLTSEITELKKQITSKHTPTTGVNALRNAKGEKANGIDSKSWKEERKKARTKTTVAKPDSH